MGAYQRQSSDSPGGVEAPGLRWSASAPRLLGASEEEVSGGESRLSAAPPIEGSRLSAIAPPIEGSRLSAMAPDIGSSLSATTPLSTSYELGPAHRAAGDNTGRITAPSYSPPKMTGGPVPLHVVAGHVRVG